MPNSCFRYALFAIITGLLLRTLFLEYPDLLDPTEARYAVVAQNMVNSGNWLTPTLPLDTGLEPYLGKPPLHFWLTAFAYRVFGFDEWTARLPSFLATILSVIAVFFTARRIWDQPTAWISTLVYLSSSMVYLLSGASVTDVTLATTCTFATGSMFLSVQQRSTKWALVAAAAGALGFLTKGPVALVLICSPFILWSLVRRDFAWVRVFPWIKCGLLFLVVASPWFILSEISNPGFNRYFFWNENLARYLFKDYGDKYGTGHVHMYGTSWLMLFIGFLPWSLVAYFLAAKSCIQRQSCLPRNECKNHLFVWIWALTTPLFFTFVRQLHAMYLLPAIAPASMLMARWLVTSSCSEGILRKLTLSRYTLPAVIAVNLIIIVVGFRLIHSWESVIFATLILALCIAALRVRPGSDSRVSLTGRISLIAFFTFGTSFAAFSNFLSATRSSEDVVELLVASDTCKSLPTERTIGVSTKNSFSHYWAANAWKTELAGPVKIKYFDPKLVSPDGICAYLYKGKQISDAPLNLRTKFSLDRASGDWLVFVPKNVELTTTPLRAQTIP